MAPVVRGPREVGDEAEAVRSRLPPAAGSAPTSVLKTGLEGEDLLNGAASHVFNL